MRSCSQFFPALEAMLARYRLHLEVLPECETIPGSYWGAPEAGLIGAHVYVRADTPLHSALHEAAHVICMDDTRRARLYQDAGGEYAEEDAVCYLQIVLAQQLGVPVREICADMDQWGYSFRLGSAYDWFTQDAAEARAWLVRQDLISRQGQPSWRCRGDEPSAAPVAALME